MLYKKSQEEIVGFVVIMLVVAVIFLVFLGIYVRKGTDGAIMSIEVSQFMDSALFYTTECSLNGYHFLSVEELIKECSSERQCTSGRQACEVFEETMEMLIESGWNFGEDSPYKGYEMKARRSENDGSGETTLFHSRVNLAVPGGNVYRGADRQIFTRDGKIIISMSIYLN